ncbi:MULTISPECIES: fumarylacetoacetate hydrolase family protein [Streptomyces]|uniref:2-keto-4-pentenoate hydratase/2-oxohepta-3-ene-1,7-dioic acid hydratase in catechol pathway n=1 Tax=Streptomyces stelliscabiei TaxID=146820 RepID=A0A8I0P465_9ACTN|nr:fumarylacetoacetate hydrolase family protein [Streptomyces stelliscabiei]MBE1596732.1 2-keto-4-pentenoate hydratase/2-oxohepta-3-ene-1,7-dioic acid hydratase in catechol pathway [Streptomyces stelliscabiei]MDX2514538.1 fumarylacetoacetate hydrolase family protein [Streptomyces stelliscabiei]MDX2551239.1 fumarylacetoacetate hydrolase family protein [Streptomyces stelliscabiei]MDX2615295.1 fumarylacetoacetate hydrolase family protein [Streptomyces stelliscabiei]MDX2633899.1 fumarylacetoacetat
MRIAVDADTGQPLIVGDGRSWSVAELLPDVPSIRSATIADVIAAWAELGPRCERAISGAGPFVPGRVRRLGPPAGPATKIICAIDNYRDHAAEFATEIFPKPIFFLKPATTLIGEGATVLLPQNARRVDYELELATVIGTRCRDVRPQDAAEVIFGYTVFLDMSARDFRSIPYTWFGMKAWDTFGPIGPYVVEKQDIGEAQALRMTLTVNGETRMTGHTGDMIFSVADLVSAASEVVTLMPGDVIATGTMAGVCQAEHGDEVEATIEETGTLRVKVARSDAATHWHDRSFPEQYASFRDQPRSDSGPDPIAPADGE